MGQDKVFNDWKEFARTDWYDLQRYVLKTYGSQGWTAVQEQFRKRMNVGQNVLEQLSAIALGKVQDVALGSVLSTGLTVADFFSQVAGHIFIANANTFYGRTRHNPHNLDQQAVFSSEWTVDTGAVGPYVDFMLYWYPRDLDAGFHGFRYGGIGPLPQS